jgi:hypothetical protein
VTGGDAAPIIAAMALVGIAGAVALPSARGILRTLVGVLLVAAGVWITAAAAIVLVEGIPAGPAATEIRSNAVWPVQCVLGGVLVAVGGLLAVARGRRWAALGRRYEAPGGKAPGDLPMWDSLDRGEDPTAR